jgi:hypothetical protein
MLKKLIVIRSKAKVGQLDMFQVKDLKIVELDEVRIETCLENTLECASDDRGEP